VKELSTKVLTLDSREVAEMVGKRHSDLIRDIETYLQYLENAKLRSDDFFMENSYKAGTGKNYKKFDCTKKGCEFIAHKLTGQKGTVFTATYINRFHEMEAALAGGNQKIVPEIKQKEIEARLNNSKARQANVLLKIADKINIPEYKRILSSYATKIITGEYILPLPETERTYTAGEIAEELGVTANAIGRVANANNLKTEEYGVRVWDKSQYSNKQVQSWRYNQKGKEKLIELLTE
jgi:Rha family phage regulatory protein